MRGASKFALFSGRLFVVGAILLASVEAKAQETFNLNSSGNCFAIGQVSWDNGASPTKATLCWASSGTETAVELRTDSTTGGLNQDVIIDALAGIDSGSFIQTASSSAPSACDCGFTGNIWSPLTFNGYSVWVQGGDGADLLSGAGGSGDVLLSGEVGKDVLYNYSSIGQMDGGQNDDQLVSDTTGGSDYLLGGSSDDCLWDTSGSYATCDCMSDDTDDLRHESHSCSNCEMTTDCCGIGC